MAWAEFKILKCTETNAATETDTSGASYFLSADNASTTPSSYPLAIPNAGTTLSYEAWFRLQCTAAPNNYAENFDVWGPNTQPDDPSNKLTVYMGASVSGVTPINTTSTVADTIQHTNYYEAGNALTFDNVNETVTAISDQTRFFVMQLVVAPFATTGTQAAMLFNMAWDET